MFLRGGGREGKQHYYFVQENKNLSHNILKAWFHCCQACNYTNVQDNMFSHSIFQPQNYNFSMITTEQS